MRLLAAMSGGVDSSVATALTVEAGHDVTGITLKQWEFGDEEVRAPTGCNTLDAATDAHRVADTLGIAHYTLDFREIFEREVVDPFITEYRNGRTPNPCIRCNQRVRFGELAERAERLGFDGLVTGHYARVTDGRLYRANDLSKDQSYVLYAIRPEVLARAHFPLGVFDSKDAVRAEARRLGLPTADREDSVEVCFVGDHRRPGDLVAERAPAWVRSGPILDVDGRQVGEHRGLAYYTVGQRRGLGSLGRRRYVTSIDAAANALVVNGEEALDTTSVTADAASWVAGPPTTGERLHGMVRYQGELTAGVVEEADDTVTMRFERGVRAAAPGQALVLYRGDEVVGGGTIVG